MAKINLYIYVYWHKNNKTMRKEMSHFPQLKETVSEGFGEKEIQSSQMSFFNMYFSETFTVFLRINRNTHKIL